MLIIKAVLLVCMYCVYVCVLIFWCLISFLLLGLDTVVPTAETEMSQGATKLVGICGVCRGEFRLQKGGTLYAHGERRGRCAGSNKPPLSVGHATAPTVRDPAGLPAGNVPLSQPDPSCLCWSYFC